MDHELIKQEAEVRSKLTTHTIEEISNEGMKVLVGPAQEPPGPEAACFKPASNPIFCIRTPSLNRIAICLITHSLFEMGEVQLTTSTCTTSYQIQAAWIRQGTDHNAGK